MMCLPKGQTKKNLHVQHQGPCWFSWSLTRMLVVINKSLRWDLVMNGVTLIRMKEKGNVGAHCWRWWWEIPVHRTDCKWAYALLWKQHLDPTSAFFFLYQKISHIQRFCFLVHPSTSSLTPLTFVSQKPPSLHPHGHAHQP